MKIYVKASGNVPHITDLFDYIDTIVFVDDARTFNMSAIAASVDDDLRTIANMSDDEVHSITDPGTLELINQQYPEKLSEEQISILKEYFFQKYCKCNVRQSAVVRVFCPVRWGALRCRPVIVWSGFITSCPGTVQST